MSDQPAEQANNRVAIPEAITVKEFAEKLDVPATEVIAKLLESGVLATVNQTIDFDTASIIADDFGVELEQAAASGKDETSFERTRTKLAEGEGETRPPVVAVMGHVDHGKTTLLDALRDAHVAEGEAGGITQHISAYQIKVQERAVTFLDTPGHEAFSALRQHGARLTDVVLLVVAADDGIKPQTEEAIKFAKAAGVKLVVAINKIDKPEADTARVRSELAEAGLMPEEWGGSVPVVDISAKAQTNLDKLLEVVLLVTDLEDLRSRVDGVASGIVIEAQMARGQGPVATVLVEHGHLNVGDYVVIGAAYGRVRSLTSTVGERIKDAGPSFPVIVSGLKTLPAFGDEMIAAPSEKEARSEAARIEQQRKDRGAKKASQYDELIAAIDAGKTKKLPVVVKADAQGSLESVLASLDVIGNDEVSIKVISSGLGDVSETDVDRAAAAGAAIIGFHVGLPGRLKRQAAHEGVNVTLYTVIYELIETMRDQLSDLLEPETVETEVGSLEVKGVFRTTKSAVICGGRVTSGKIYAGVLVRMKDGEEVGEIERVQREQAEVKEVKEGDMCGLGIKTSQKTTINEGDNLVFFTRETKARSL